MLNWKDLLNPVRRKSLDMRKQGKKGADSRSESERDYDRILFATPLRRLADKMQVFPLEENDSIRTRLTPPTRLAIWLEVLGCVWRLIMPKGCLD